MKKVFIRLSYLITFSILLSCQKDIVTEPNSNNVEDYKISLEKAKTICKQPSLKNGRIEVDKIIISAKTKKDSKGEDIYHVITYDNNKGYKVISADKRAFPLLTESESGQFDTTVTGVAIWMHGLEGYIEKQKAKNLTKSEDKYLKSIWKDFEDTGDPLKQIKSKKKGRVAFVPDDGGGGSNCQDSYQANENLFTTAWGQTGGYNIFCMPDPCGFSNNYCGRVPAGCGAVSMAQIMFRHQRPLGFNYGIMSSSANFLPTVIWNPGACTFTVGETETGRLIHHAGDLAGSTPITTSTPWSCSTSTSTFP
jgi:hypothetical protein